MHVVFCFIECLAVVFNGMIRRVVVMSVGMLMSSIVLMGITSCQKDDVTMSEVLSKDDNSVGEDSLSEINDTSNGLPIIRIVTPNGFKIYNRDDYMDDANITVLDKNLNEMLTQKVKIRGRGNTSWFLMPKKSYKIKFYEPHSLFGEAEDKEWVLIANYCDKTMIRNALAYKMGYDSNLDYTTSFHFVDLELNGEKQGTYMVAEQVKASKSRVDVGNDGFLVVVEAHASNDDVTFGISSLPVPVTLKHPKVLKDSDEVEYVQTYIQEASDVLFGNKFLDADVGYGRYFDINSFVDWYLINEISRNSDAIMYASCYMNFRRGGKIKMGPIWDFDIAFGNVNYNECWNAEGFWVKNKNSYYVRMFHDSEFVNKLKERMNYFYTHKQQYLDFIDEMAGILYKSQEANEQIWHVINEDVWPCYVVCGSYEGEIDRLKTWLSNRMDWMQNEIQGM